MITTLGKTAIRAYIAGLAPSIGQTLAVGIRNNAPAVGDTQMGFEVARVPVTSVSLDPSTNKIVFKGTMDSADAVKVYEIGLWSSEASEDSSLVLGFDDFDEAWEGDVVGFSEATATSRIGTSLMDMTVTDATSKVATYPIESTDMSTYLGPDDSWAIAFNKAGTANLTVKLKLTSGDGAGSLEFNFFPSNVSAAGYTFGSALVKNATVTGSFDPSAITQFDVTVAPVAGNAATSTIQLDGVVATNASYERNGSVLVARALVSPVFSTNTATPTDLEYELEVLV